MGRSDSSRPDGAGGFGRAVARATRGFLVWIWKPTAAVAALCVIALAAADGYVEEVGRRAIYGDSEKTPKVDAALVLGTSKYVTPGRQNRYYQTRIEAAASLYRAGKVRAIVVSGDNSTARYNEPQRMKEDLVEMGVPAEYVTCDYAGFRTLDSVVRMKEVFGISRYAIVSQDFHVARALYIARALGQDPVGFAAEGGDEWPLKVRLREIFARAVAILDVNVFRRAPRFLGEPVKVPLAPPQAGG